MNTPIRTESRIESPLTGPIVAAPTSVSGQSHALRESTRMQSAMMLARNFPRDEQAALAKLERACTRPALAEEGLYEYARGGTKISGPSIRLAEEMGRCWGNIFCGVEETRGNGASEWRTFAWDLESLWGDEKLFTVRHWRDTKQGGYAVTDERDVYEIGANMAARRKRACILACIPEYAKEAAVAQVKKTLEKLIDTSPERIATMLSAFKDYGVTKEMIEKRLQRNLDSITSAGMVLMRNIFNSLRDGVGKVSDHFEVPEPDAVTDANDHNNKTTAERAKEAIRRRDRKPETKESARKDAPGAGDGGEESGGQGTMPFFDNESALTSIKSATAKTLLETWRRILKDYLDSHRVLPNSVSIEALRKCGDANELTGLWKFFVASFRDAELEMPIEVESVYNDRIEVLKVSVDE